MPALEDWTHVTFEYLGQERSFSSPIPQTYLIGIGAVIAAWAKFDFWFETLLEQMRWHPTAAKVSPQGSFQQRGAALIATAAIALPDCPSINGEVAAIAAAGAYLSERRNEVAHSAWFSAGDTNEMRISRQGRKGTVKSYATVTPNDLLELERRLSDLWRRLAQILNADMPLHMRNPFPDAERLAWAEHRRRLRPPAAPDQKRQPRRQFLD